jgi:hypothetical protein
VLVAFAKSSVDKADIEPTKTPHANVALASDAKMLLAVADIKRILTTNADVASTSATKNPVAVTGVGPTPCAE